MKIFMTVFLVLQSGNVLAHSEVEFLEAKKGNEYQKTKESVKINIKQAFEKDGYELGQITGLIVKPSETGTRSISQEFFFYRKNDVCSGVLVESYHTVNIDVIPGVLSGRKIRIECLDRETKDESLKLRLSLYSKMINEPL